MFKLMLTLENDSMHSCDDVSRALSRVAARLRGRDWSEWEEKILDDNGNAVGSWRIEGAAVSEDDSDDAGSACEHPDDRRDQTPLGEVFCLDCGERRDNDEES